MVAAIVGSSYPPDDARAATIEVLVTSSADDLEDATCPDDTRCTLRQAIETVNVSPLMAGDHFAIRFDTDIFPPDAPVTIDLETPLPELTRAVTQVDGTGVGVVIDGALLPDDNTVTGLRLDANNVKVRGLTIRNFAGTCLSVTGEDIDVGGLRSMGQAVSVDSCPIGIVAAGPGAIVSGNEVGLQSENATYPMDFGIVLGGLGGTVGGSDSDRANYVANAGRAVAIGTVPGAVASVRNNVIGESPAGARGEVETGVTIFAAANGVSVTENRFVGTNVAIAVSEIGEAPAESTQNSLRENEFENIGSMAIDLGEDGIRNPNDPGDADTGPNNYQNHPVFDRVVQAEVSGSVPGPCVGCLVELYIAEHRPGDVDVPTVRVADGVAVTNAAGEFTFGGPQVSPGDWLMATATDPDGNTSEFGPSARVGTGILQCGNVSLRPGWNSAGYFGSLVNLSAVFPPGLPPPGPVVSIHSLVAGTRNYQSWFRGGGGLSTLTSMAPGEAYWYWAEQGSTVPGSFTLGVPVPIELSEGWNHFVYIGAAEGIDVAFETIAGSFDAVYRYDNSGGAGEWSIHAGGDVPEWVQGFTEVEPCTAYYILMNEDATLEPPQP